MASKIFNIVLVTVAVIWIASCSSIVTGAQDVGDIDRTQPNKIESVQDTLSDQDYVYSQSDDEWYYRQTGYESYGGIPDSERW